jgi:predicted RNA-binding Zn-ribbon protein involved in translation (DUF1610 family)
MRGDRADVQNYGARHSRGFTTSQNHRQQGSRDRRGLVNRWKLQQHDCVLTNQVVGVFSESDHMSILTNAVDSIALGVEDFNSKDPRRHLSSTRNLVAGILLLYKHKLAMMSPHGTDEVLIKQRVLPFNDSDNGIVWRGEGSKTVDVQQIRERCQSLGIAVDWKRVERIVKLRNEIEHYFTSENQSAVQSVVADTFILIRDFVRTQLGEDPLVLLGGDTWNTLTSEAEVYKAEKEECEMKVTSINWESEELRRALVEWECPECGSGLIDVQTTVSDQWSAVFKCRSCGKQWEFEDAAEKAVEDYFAGENFSAIKDGGEPRAVTCPECSLEAYDLDEDRCLICGESVERRCQRCGNPIPASELDGSGFCGYCNHMMSKDD